MKHLFVNNEIVLLTETWSNDLFYEVTNFYYYILHRKLNSKCAKRDSGGLIIYVHHKLKQYVELVKFSGDCLIWLKFSKSLFNFENGLFVCLAYITPKGTIYNKLVNGPNSLTIHFTDLFKFYL
jgi:hypothetical protein